MAEVRWTPQAADDLDAIAEFISQDSPHYSYRLRQELVEILTVFHGSRLLDPSKLN